MRATIAWSYELLTPTEQALLRSLSVFSGGADLDDIDIVCAPTPGHADLMLDTLSSLAAKQLIVRDRAPDLPEPRINLLETVRSFGLEQLEQRGEATHVRARHARRFLANAEAFGPGLMGPNQRMLVKRFTRDAENLYAGLGHLIATGSWNEAIRLMWALWRFWWMRGEFSGIGRRTAGILAEHRVELQPLQLAQAMVIAGSDIWAKGSEARLGLSVTREGVDLAISHGDHRTAGIGAMTAGILAIGIKTEHERAATLFSEARRQFSMADQTWGDAMSLGFLAVISLDNGDLTRARAQVIESIALGRVSGDQVTVHQANYTLGLISLSEGKIDEAEQLFTEGLRLARDVGDITNAGYFLRGLSGAATLAGDHPRAVRLSQSGRYLLETASAPPSRHYHVDQQILGRLDERARSTIRERDLEAIRLEAFAMPVAEAMAFALGD